MSPVTSAHDLYEHFVQAVSEKPPSQQKFRTIWRLIIEHPWYQSQLITISQRVVRHHAGCIFPEDIQQDAMLLLARSLRRHPDLRFDPDQSIELFSHWMRRIIFRDCLQALRRLTPSQECVPLREKSESPEFLYYAENPAELESSLEMLSPTERFVVDQYLGGNALKDTARVLKVSLSTVHRRFQSAMTVLRRQLAPNE